MQGGGLREDWDARVRWAQKLIARQGVPRGRGPQSLMDYYFKKSKNGIVFCRGVRSGGVGHNIGASCHVTDGHVFQFGPTDALASYVLVVVPALSNIVF